MRAAVQKRSGTSGVLAGVFAVALASSALALSAPAAESAPAKSPATPAALLAARKAIAERESARDTTGLSVLLLENGSPNVRAAAAVALGRIQNPGSVPALALALGDKSLIVRREAAFALGLVGDSTASPALLLRLNPEVDPAVRASIVTALGMLGARSAGPALARSVRAPRATERWAAALAAGRARDSSLVEPLVAAAKDARPEMRWRVAYALGRIGDRQGASALRKLSTDKVEIVRYSAARALGEVGDSAAAPRLVALLADPSWRVRVNAAHALGSLKAWRDARSLRPLLKDSSPHVRWEATLALGAIRDSAAVPALTAALQDTASGVVQGAAMALLQIEDERAVSKIAPAIDLLPGFLRSGLLEALGPVPGPLALEMLLARARDSTDAPQAAGAASGLAKRPADAAVSIPVLRRLLLGDRDYTVVSSAMEALGALGDSASVPALVQFLSRSGNTESADIRASAVSALIALKTAPALEALHGVLHDPERRIREAAAAALGLPPGSAAAGPAPALRVEPIPASPAASATVETDRGTIRIALDAGHAPRAVENFARLARSGYFDGLAFHRVVPNFVVQDGCPRGDGWGGPGYAIPCEYNALPYEVGTVGMALAGKDTGGSQWFITLSPQPRLEGRYTVFGKVVVGIDVVERIMPGDRILRVTVR
jgi:HEAT repeat protein/cyclophilin family peptidyl-prolyl cis-trans isomerase